MRIYLINFFVSDMKSDLILFQKALGFAIRKRFLVVAAAIFFVILLIINNEIEFTLNEKSLNHHINEHFTRKTKLSAYEVPKLDKEDYTRLINLTDFEFNILNTCSNNNIFLVVVVTTAPQNFQIRDTIRTTWGKNYNDVKTFFMLGSVNNQIVQEALVKENEKFGDIVQGNFLDAYNNLTYKTVMALKFITYHCPNAIYVLKTDDDVFVNMPLMKNFLTHDVSPFGALNCLMCHKMENKPIIRNYSKWAVSEKEFPGKYYPTYCNGPYSIFSPDVVFKLYKKAQTQKYFHIEDVFIYGLAVSNYPEIKHTDIKYFTLWAYYTPESYKIQRTKQNFLFGFLGMGLEQLEEFWEFVNKQPVKKSIYD